MEREPNNSWPVMGASALAEYAKVIGIDPRIEWQMESSEQLALLALVQNLRPECAVEVGSRYGGSLQILSRYAKRVISCDIDPTCRERLGKANPNVEFVTGRSQATLPGVMKRLQEESAKVGLILIDGDHTAQGVKGDIEALLEYVPGCPVYVIVHDSFNPDVRQGIRTARWAESPYVHCVEMDFVPGVIHQGGEAHREMWGGFALAVWLPVKREGKLVISARKDRLFRAVFRHSVHWFFDPMTLAKRVGRKVRKWYRKVGSG
jgi:SAM-dependent methyltransferase